MSLMTTPVPAGGGNHTQENRVAVQTPRPASAVEGGWHRPPPSPPTNPDVQEARNWADNLEARRNELWQEAIRLKGMRNPNGSYPAKPFNEYYEKLNRFDRDRTSVLKEEAPLWKASLVTEEDKKEVDKQLERINKLNDYPPEMEELGTP